MSLFPVVVNNDIGITNTVQASLTSKTVHCGLLMRKLGVDFCNPRKPIYPAPLNMLRTFTYNHHKPCKQNNTLTAKHCICKLSGMASTALSRQPYYYQIFDLVKQNSLTFIAGNRVVVLFNALVTNR